ncbi:hypothetical protein PMIN02_004151 [Paraphaeosphaeria minitans]
MTGPITSNRLLRPPSFEKLYEPSVLHFIEDSPTFATPQRDQETIQGSEKSDTRDSQSVCNFPYLPPILVVLRKPILLLFSQSRCRYSSSAFRHSVYSKS